MAAASRQDICARSAMLAPKVNSPQGGDFYLIRDLIKTLQVCQPPVVLEFPSSSYSIVPASGDVDGCMRARGGGIRRGAMFFFEAAGCRLRPPVGGMEMPPRVSCWANVAESLGTLSYFGGS